MFREALANYVDGDSVQNGVDEASAESFPASDPAAAGPGEDSTPAPAHSAATGARGRTSHPMPVTFADGGDAVLDHGAVVIAAITSCTNTSNPSVMVGAALLAKKAVEKGLERKPWVKTSLAPGSKVVTDYYDRSGLTPYLEKLGFNLVGYGCTTCIGNSGPIIDEVSAAVNEGDLAATAVLSGNRNFEGRINPDVKMNYLASPPLVVAYALAGSMDVDLFNEPLGTGSDGSPVFLKDIWPTPQEIEEVIDQAIASEMYTTDYADVFAGDERWQGLPTPEGSTFEWDPQSTYVRKPPYFDGMQREPSAGHRHRRRPRAAQARRLGHHRPHQPGRRDQGRLARRHVPVRARCRPPRLQLLRLTARQPRGHDPRDVRQHPAAQPAGAGHGGRLHARLHPRRRGHARSTRRRVNYAEAGTPLVILAGKEYGSGSSRDWAAKGTALLGVRAVIAESYERIHRSNLIGMGVLPLQFPDGETAESLGLTGEETFAISGIEAMNSGADAADGHRPGRRHRVRGAGAHRHPRRGRVLPARRHHAVRPALAALTRLLHRRSCPRSTG